MKRLTKILIVISLLFAVGPLIILAMLAPPYAQMHAKQRVYGSVGEALAALTRNPNDARAHRTLAQASERDPVVAHEEWRKAVESEPNNEFSRLMYGIRLRNVDREQAKKIVTPVLKSWLPRYRLEAEGVLREMEHSRRL